MVSASGNRKAIRVQAEPFDIFRRYMATYAREQAYCHLSEQLIRNWSAIGMLSHASCKEITMRAFTAALTHPVRRQPHAQSHFESMDVFELEWASNPQISPDGSRVLYERNSMDIMEDKSRRRALDREHRWHRPPAAFEGSARSLVPDGTKLAYIDDSQSLALDGYRRHGQAHAADEIATRHHMVARRPAHRVLDARSPSRRRKLRRSRKSPKVPSGQTPEAHHALEEPRRRRRLSRHGFYHLFVLPVEGGTPRQVTSGSFHHRDAPVWTPDSQIARLLREPQRRLGIRVPKL